MNRALALLPLVASIVFALLCAHGASREAGRVRVNGRDYVRLLDWAQANQFEWRWLKRDETFQLARASAQLQFAVDSREAWVNQLRVWLLFPLVSRQGGVYIARQDLDATLQPLLSRLSGGGASPIKTICLDPGHGGKDPGNRAGSRAEKDYTLRLAFELRDQLRRAGFKVILTRSSDTFLELSDRPAIAGRRGADLFVSLHFNATESGREDARGAEVYCLTPAGAPSTNARGEGSRAGSTKGNRFDEKNLRLAYEIQKALARSLGAEDRGVRRARWAVLREATMPAVLIEAGFMTHPAEGKKILDPTYRREIARAILDGILGYKRAAERGG